MQPALSAQLKLQEALLNFLNFFGNCFIVISEDSGRCDQLHTANRDSWGREKELALKEVRQRDTERERRFGLASKAIQQTCTVQAN